MKFRKSTRSRTVVARAMRCDARTRSGRVRGDAGGAGAGRRTLACAPITRLPRLGTQRALELDSERLRCRNEQGERSRLVGRQKLGAAPASLRDHEREPRIQDAGVNVASTTHGQRVPQRLGSEPDRVVDDARGRSLGGRLLCQGDRIRGDHRRGPRPEVLGRIVVAGRGFQVRIHVARADASHFAILDVLEEFVTGKIATAANDVREALVVERDVVLLARLAAKADAYAFAADLDVPVAQRRQAVAAVLLAIALAADPHARAIEQRYHRGDHLVPRQAGPREIALDATAYGRKRFGELRETVEL